MNNLKNKSKRENIIPLSQKHETKIRVQYFETDAMGIVHHANYIRYFETARTEFIRDAGYSYNKIEEAGLLIPVLDVSCTYKVPALYDEVISVYCWLEKLGAASFEVGYEVVNSEDGTLHATGHSRHAFTDKNLKPVPLKKTHPEIYKVFYNISKDL